MFFLCFRWDSRPSQLVYKEVTFTHLGQLTFKLQQGSSPWRNYTFIRWTRINMAITLCEVHYAKLWTWQSWWWVLNRIFNTPADPHLLMPPNKQAACWISMTHPHSFPFSVTQGNLHPHTSEHRHVCCWPLAVLSCLIRRLVFLWWSPRCDEAITCYGSSNIASHYLRVGRRGESLQYAKVSHVDAALRCT